MEHIFREHSKRRTFSLNGEWKFCIDKDGVGKDGKWYESFPEDFNYINVPSCWNLELGYYGYVGKAWYQKEFETSDTYLQLSFGSVTGQADVYLDGKYLGSHYGTWLEFSFGTYVSAGVHSVVVCVDNTPNSLNTIPLRIVDWYNYGGITRSVEVTEFDKPFIKGDKVRYTLNENLDKASITVELSLDNPFDIEYTTDIEIWCDDKLLKTEKASFKKDTEIIIDGIELDNIKLWDIGKGNLYNFRIATHDDDVYEKIGFRKIEAKNNQIFLNGKSIYIKGVNRHEAHPDWGFAVPLNVNRRDFQIIKDLGCNTVRGSHYPNTHGFLDYLDRDGMLFWSEVPMWGSGTHESLTAPLTFERLKKMHEEMIDQYYNHPCIVIWGLHNEISTNTEDGYELTKKIRAFVESKDKTRLINFTTNRFLKDICLELTDVVCINAYLGWYGDAIEDWKAWFANVHNVLESKNCADKPVIMSEFGCPALHEYSSLNGEKWSTDYQTRMLTEVINDSIATEGVCGTLVWQFCNSPSDMDLAKARGFNNKGILDEYRHPKLAYYAIREIYKSIE